jgi:hypothetical protein
MVVINPASGAGDMGFTTSQPVGSHRYVDFRPSSTLAEDGQRFINPIDDMMIRALLLEQAVA